MKEIKLRLHTDSVDKIEKIKAAYKEIGFDYDDSHIINMLILGKRETITAKDNNHFWDLLEYEIDRSYGESRRWNTPTMVIINIPELGNYMAEYDKGNTEMQEDEIYDLDFMPCESRVIATTKTQWVAQNGGCDVEPKAKSK